MARRTSSSIAALAALAVLGCASAKVTPEDVTRLMDTCERMSHEGPVALTPGPRLAVPAALEPKKPVLIYGASWCRACDYATAYLKRRGIPFVERDVEREDGAEIAMHDLLARSGLPVKDSLPVMDVRGTVMVGFMPCVVDELWRKP